MSLASTLKAILNDEGPKPNRLESHRCTDFSSWAAASSDGGFNAEACHVHRVLIIDDDRNLAQLLYLILQGEGYEVVVANTAREGERSIWRDRPDLVILDLSLGAEDGRDLYRNARRCAYTGPFLILSAHGAQAAARELGADGWVAKPFEPELLLREVRRLLEPASFSGK